VRWHKIWRNGGKRRQDTNKKWPKSCTEAQRDMTGEEGKEEDEGKQGETTGQK
jgi:hypothetical protein